MNSMTRGTNHLVNRSELILKIGANIPERFD